MNVKVVFHIDFDEEKLLLMTLGNCKNLLKEVDVEQSSICILANGSSVKLLKKNTLASYASDIDALAKAGIKFFICNNSLTKFDLRLEDMLPVCETVKAGVLKLIELQNDQFAYIKP